MNMMNMMIIMIIMIIMIFIIIMIIMIIMIIIIIVIVIVTVIIVIIIIITIIISITINTIIIIIVIIVIIQMDPVVSTLSCSWHLWDGSQTIRHVGKLQTGGWRQVAREFASDLLGIVSSGCIQEKNTLPVGSPNYSGIAEMAINNKHALMIFTEMILHPRNPTWNCMLFLRSLNMNLWHGLKWILFPGKSCN